MGLPKGNIPWNKVLVGYSKNIVHTKGWNSKVSAGLRRYYSDKLKNTRQGPLGRAWTKNVLGRDFYICRVCGKHATIAHHICPRKDFPDVSLRLWNGASDFTVATGATAANGNIWDIHNEYGGNKATGGLWFDHPYNC